MISAAFSATIITVEAVFPAGGCGILKILKDKFNSNCMKEIRENYKLQHTLQHLLVVNF